MKLSRRKVAMQKAMVLGAFFLSMVVVSFGAKAQSCTDWRGVSVSTRSQPGLGDAAKATVIYGQPVILVDPYVVSTFSNAMRTFTFAHECAHHALGHLASGFVSLSAEREADCAAIRFLYRTGQLTPLGAMEIAQTVSWSPGDFTHDAGAIRAALLKACTN
jgi:hypothetical protein